MCNLCNYKEYNTNIPTPPSMIGWSIDGNQNDFMKFISPDTIHWVEVKFIPEVEGANYRYEVKTNIEQMANLCVFEGDKGRKAMQDYLDWIVDVVEPPQLDVQVISDLPKDWVQEFGETPEGVKFIYTNGKFNILVYTNGKVQLADYITNKVLDENKLLDIETLERQVKFYMLSANSGAIIHPNEIEEINLLQPPQGFEPVKLDFPGVEFTNGKDNVHIMPDGRVCLLDDNRMSVDVISSVDFREVKENLNTIISNINKGYYKSNEFKEAKKMYKKWHSLIDSRTCEYCRAMNGKKISNFAKFWFDIKGKQYGLNEPPLHWVFTKSGSKIITCRCVLDFDEEAPEVVDEDTETSIPSAPKKKEVPKEVPKEVKKEIPKVKEPKVKEVPKEVKKEIPKEVPKGKSKPEVKK